MRGKQDAPPVNFSQRVIDGLTSNSRGEPPTDEATGGGRDNTVVKEVN